MKKEKTVKAAKAPKLVSYTIKATIPTCQYGNIQPEITVMAGTIEEAESFVLPHINKLFADYAEEPINKRLRFINKVPEVKQPAKVEPSKVITPVITPDVEDNVGIPPPEQQSEALKRALDAVEACKNKEALEIIGGRITASVKLTQDEKHIALSAWTAKHV